MAFIFSWITIFALVQIAPQKSKKDKQTDKKTLKNDKQVPHSLTPPPNLDSLATTHTNSNSMEPFSCSRLYLIFCCFYYCPLAKVLPAVCVVTLKIIFSFLHIQELLPHGLYVTAVPCSSAGLPSEQWKVCRC